ncbi:MAG: 1-acyl-sn-glycerol-3-phosphate acyltransferase [Erysipelotrichales bacterium]|nr:1-acyl-sn-glycerol-3-phosphate acyltransferase [Erysipelotrichales bacterium]
MKRIKYYYFDEENDDFGNFGINTKVTPDDYDYNPKSKWWRFWKKTVYLLAAPIVFIGEFFILGGRIKNLKVLKPMKKRKEGYFVYSNHTSPVSDTFSVPVLSFPRSTYIIASPDSISIKGLKTILRFLGVLPLPSSKRSYINFVKAINDLYKKGNVISIYPEAHIWPKYNKIREFKDTSFYYPVKLNAPIYVKTTVYKKKRNGKSKQVLYMDGPFYPNLELSSKEAQKELRDRVYAQMCKRVEEHQSYLDKRYEYIKVNSKEEVRTEIIK